MITPLGKRLLLQPLEEKTGILIYETPFEKFTVVAIGDEVTKLKINDVVYLESSYLAQPIEHDGQKYMWITEECILGKIS